MITRRYHILTADGVTTTDTWDHARRLRPRGRSHTIDRVATRPDGTTITTLMEQITIPTAYSGAEGVNP